MRPAQLLIAGALSVLASQANAMPIQDVTATPIGSNAVQVNWSADADAAYYEVYQDSSLILSNVVGTSTQVTGLDSSTAYQFFVTACNSDRECSQASSQADVFTDTGSSSSLGVCNPATDGPRPRVALTVSADTATVSWCEVTGAEGYNLFLNNEYVRTLNASTLSTTVPYTGEEQYQVAWYANGNFPSKSAVAMQIDVDVPIEPPTEPQTDVEIVIALEMASSSSDNDVEIYFTRHAEKMTLVEEQDDGSLMEVCGEKNCAEVLNAKGELRAELLATFFRDGGITNRLTHGFSSHKIRTRQTIEMITGEAGLNGDMDKFPDDGIQEFPVLNDGGTDNATELDPEGTTASEQPIIDALLTLPAGSVALVAGHSGTLYDIMSGIGLGDVCLADTVESCNQDRYPINADVKVKNFGDIWKVTLEGGSADFIYRINLQPVQLSLDELAQ